MNILFLHRNFPGQFKHLVKSLAIDSDNTVFFITNNDEIQIEGVNKLLYEVKQNAKNVELSPYEDSLTHGLAAAEVAKKLKDKGFRPDVIYGHSWGVTMFIKDVFPDVPLACYFEWFYNPEGADFEFFIKNQSVEELEGLRCKNSSILTDLCSCDAGLTPTNWQKSQFPEEFQHKLKVIHDGIDTDVCRPDKDARFFVEDKNLELTVKDEVVTYATRGMEPYRGFPNFMKAVEVLLKKRPKTHFIIAGEDEVFYGMKIPEISYKELLLREFDIDLARVHFVGTLPYEEYTKLLQISSAHVYLTCPFVLSWSVLEAMSIGCCVVASDTQPVKEVIKDGENGILFDFFNINQLVESIEYVLDNPNKVQKIRENARQTISCNYSLSKLLPNHIEFLKNLI